MVKGDLHNFSYTVPNIANGILGWGSELKNISRLFHQISQNLSRSVGLEPTIVLESQDLYDKYMTIVDYDIPQEINSTIKFVQRLSNLLISNILRFNHHYAKYIEYVKLCEKEKEQDIKKKYVAFIDEIVSDSSDILVIIKNKFIELFATEYVKERMKLVLQNPFKLEILEEEAANKPEELKNLLQLALYKVRIAIAEELLGNPGISHEIKPGLVDLSLDINDNITTDKFDICELEISGLVPIFEE